MNTIREINCWLWRWYKSFDAQNAHHTPNAGNVRGFTCVEDLTFLHNIGGTQPNGSPSIKTLIAWLLGKYMVLISQWWQLSNLNIVFPPLFCRSSLSFHRAGASHLFIVERSRGRILISLVFFVRGNLASLCVIIFPNTKPLIIIQKVKSGI